MRIEEIIIIVCSAIFGFVLVKRLLDDKFPEDEPSDAERAGAQTATAVEHDSTR